jgi:hypothetical protein
MLIIDCSNEASPANITAVFGIPADYYYVVRSPVDTSRRDLYFN